MLSNSGADAPVTPWLTVFWRNLIRIDKSKLNPEWMAARNALAMGLPLAVGIAIGHPLGGVAVATGALNVAYSDGIDPYAQRMRRMLSWSFLGAFAVFLGSVTGNYHVLAILVTSLWAFVAGLLVSISTRAGDLGLNTLVALLVYAARGAFSPKGALEAALLVLMGGLLQAVLGVLSWPLQRYRPEREAIGRVYGDLARQVGQDPSDLLSAPLEQLSSALQDTVSALGRDHSVESERFRLLFDQADRLRLSSYALSRLRTSLESEERAGGKGLSGPLELLDQMLALTREMLDGVARSLVRDDPAAIPPELADKLGQLNEAAQSIGKDGGRSVSAEFAAAADVLAGQLRVVLRLAGHSTTAGSEEFARLESAPPWRLRMRSWLATLGANLHFRSPAFRHALRLALCTAVADTIARTINTQRNYWLPMTVMVVLKPDFTSTISRGVLRLGGTFAGLLLATALFHALPGSALTQLALVSFYMFWMRYAGPANYGIFSVAISGLIVFLIAATGVPPKEVVVQRGINTLAGGIFALVAYVVWPTWEGTQVSDVIADMIDRSREYFQLVVKRLEDDSEPVRLALNKARYGWREARSKAEASVDRFGTEPGTSSVKLDALASILASSHALIRSMMGLEAAVVQTTLKHAPAAFEKFACDVEFVLYFLSASLRGSSAAVDTLPQLRDDHRKLVDAYRESAAADEYMLEETDALTVGLNTLREQVQRYVTAGAVAPAHEQSHTTIR